MSPIRSHRVESVNAFERPGSKALKSLRIAASETQHGLNTKARGKQLEQEAKQRMGVKVLSESV